MAGLFSKTNQCADDEAASGATEHSLSGNAQTSRRRLAMTHWHGRNINANPVARSFSKSRWTVLPHVKMRNI